MSEQRWIRVTPCGNVPPREGRAVRIAGREIAIFNLGDRFLATDNTCPYRRGPLCDGIVTGAAVVRFMPGRSIWRRGPWNVRRVATDACTRTPRASMTE